AQMSRVGAISGSTAKELEMLEAKAKEMGATTQFSATESAEALEYMALAGWKTEDMLDGLSGVMNLAAASGEDLGLVSDILTDGLTAFGMSAKDSAKFADILASTSSNANTNVAMLGESFKYVAPVAGALGYSIEDTSVALGLMASAGIKASSSGTALRTLMTNLASPSKTSAVAIKELGLSITDASGDMLPFNDVIMQLRGSFANLTNEQKAQYAEMLAGKEGMSGLLAIVNASQADFDKLSGAINNSSGSADEMAKTMNDNLAGALKILKSSLEGIALSLYDELQNPLKEITQYLTEMIGSLQQAFNEGGIDGLIAALGDSIGKLLTDLAEKAPQFLQIGINIIQSLLNGIGQNSNAIGESAATILTTLINGILTLLPNLANVAADLLISFTQGIIDNLPQLLQTGQEVLISLAEGISTNLPTLVNNAVEIILAL
ncbi:MAG: phage tail tape measure protein, partial [Eubacteriales bacterium]|nr:phage tail tape measure protein [Eubacteriales bacterium]